MVCKNFVIYLHHKFKANHNKDYSVVKTFKVGVVSAILAFFDCIKVIPGQKVE